MANLTTRLEQLENAQLVRRLMDEELAYLFKHALTQESAYESILIKRRRELHRRVAEAYEALYAERLDEFAALLAHHYFQGGDYDRTFEYAVRAGDLAAERYAYSEAHLAYRQALDALAQFPDNKNQALKRADTLIKQVSVSYSSDSPEDTLAQLSQAEKCLSYLRDDGDNRLRLVQLYYWMGRIQFYRGNYREAVLAFERAMREKPDEGRIAERIVFASGFKGVVLTMQGYFGEGYSLLRAAAEQLEEMGSWQEWGRVMGFTGIALAGRGYLAEAMTQSERGLVKAIELKDASLIAICHICRAQIHFLGRKPNAVLEESCAARVTGEQFGDQLIAHSAHKLESWAWSQLGDDVAAGTSLTRAKLIEQALGGRVGVISWLGALDAELALNQGRLADALTLAQQAVASAESVDAVFAQGYSHRVWGQVLTALDSPAWREAEAHQSASLELFKLGQAELDAARTHVAWGQLLQSQGDADAARDHFEKAVAQFQASGLADELERTKQLIAALPA